MQIAARRGAIAPPGARRIVIVRKAFTTIGRGTPRQPVEMAMTLQQAG
jgi:hypothetical protein